MKIYLKSFLIICFLNFTLSVISAQEFLDIDISHRCIYSGNHMDEELYAFGTDVNTMDELIKRVLELGGNLTPNFMVHQTNVVNVSAVVDNGRRYLLWSQDFLEKASRIEAYGAVAHEIGHHISEHTLSPERIEMEENEADYFMGFIFYKANFTPDQIRSFLAAMPKMPGEGINEMRYKTIMDGYKKAENYLKFKSIPFDDDPSLVNFLQAQFPFPPPECHASYEVPLSTFKYSRTLGEVSQKITRSLDQQKYPYRFLSVPDGFVIVTQMEQYNRDGTIMKGSGRRWVDQPVQESFGFSWKYIKSLIYPRKGYLRLFAFIITRQNYSSNKTRISKSEAAAWLNQGVNRLPKSIAEEPFNDDYAISLLVYEFEVPESNHRPEQSCPCHFQALEHLERSGLKDSLMR